MVFLSVAFKPDRKSNPSRKLASLSIGDISTNPSFLHILLSIDPHPPAIWTIPVPSPSTTISFPSESFPPSTTIWHLIALISFSSKS